MSGQFLHYAAVTAVMNVAIWGAAAWAGPQDVVLLSGDVAAGAQSVSIADVEALGLAEAETFNPHEASDGQYAGVWLTDLIEAFGTGQTQSVTLTAIDHYQAQFSRQEWQEMEVLLATRANGKFLEFETRGPMRVVIADYDETKRLHQETVAKWVWMITEIEFQD